MLIYYLDFDRMRADPDAVLLIRFMKVVNDIFMTGDFERQITTADAPPRDYLKISIADRMRRALKTKDGRASYAERKTTVEPVFGQIKEANQDFRQFSYRGLENAQHEWSIVCTAHNLLKIIRHRQQRKSTRFRLVA